MSCILAIRNFIARRGQPRTLYSDRGTNFVGAKNELENIRSRIDSEKIMREFITNDTEWVLIPPLSPHMGGSWERQIRTVKKNLLAVATLKKLSDETLLNFLIEVEQTVNSHPLTHVPVDDDSAPALTPNHFLLGSSNGIKPLSTLNETGPALKQNWHATQILANLFWKRWVSDYLPEITRRSKWFQEVKPIEVGDVVLIVDEKLPRNCWPKGKIIDTTPGRDGRVRSATVKTAHGTYVRPAAKIAVLDIQRNKE
uniref:Integrase catalytic domain-containing protein n=1 Tax=Anopheles minimus TaxID=112268 RepID=A0A182W8E0_9DIPT